MIVHVGQVVSQQDFNMTEILNGSETCDEPYENDTQRAQCGSCGEHSILMQLVSNFLHMHVFKLKF